VINLAVAETVKCGNNVY